MAETVWDRVRECFDTDDGSLPSVEIAGLSPAGVADVYAMLRQRSLPVPVSPEFWSRAQDVLMPVDSVPNAALLVATAEAEPFHHCISGIVAMGVELPVLGVFVWRNAIGIDYRMGREWGPEQVSGFFDLLRECCALDPRAVISLEDPEGPPNPDRFRQAWDSFNRSPSS